MLIAEATDKDSERTLPGWGFHILAALSSRQEDHCVSRMSIEEAEASRVALASSTASALSNDQLNQAFMEILPLLSRS